MGQIISITEAEARGQRGIRESWWRCKQDKRVKVDGQMAQQKFGVDSCATICLNVRLSMSIPANGFKDGVEILRRQLLAYKDHKCGDVEAVRMWGRKLRTFRSVALLFHQSSLQHYCGASHQIDNN